MTAPAVLTRNTTVDNTDVLSHAINMPSGIAAGNFLLVVVTNDGTATLSIDTGASGEDWLILRQDQNSNGGSSPHASIIYKLSAVGGDALTITLDATEQISAVAWRIDAATGVEAEVSTGNGVDSDPPNLAPAGGLAEYLWIAARCGDDGVDQASAAPTDYDSTFTTATGGGSGGTATATGERTLTAESDDPGPFTSPTEQWAAYTIAVAPIPSGGILLAVPAASVAVAAEMPELLQPVYINARPFAFLRLIRRPGGG